MSLLGYVLTCSDSCAAGVKAIHLAKASDIDTTVGTEGFTAGATGIFTAVTMNGVEVFKTYDYQDFTAEFREAPTPNTNGCSYSVQQEIELTIPCWTVAGRNAIAELEANSCCGLVALVEFTDGTVVAAGYLARQHFKLTSAPFATGKALTDSQSWVITLTAQTTEHAKSFTGTIPL